MTNSARLRTALTLTAVALAWPVSAHAAGRTETLRVYSKIQSFTITTPDGKVTHEPPAGPPQPGTVMEIDSLDYRGTYKKHERRPSFSDYLHCTFGADQDNPDCYGYVALDGSLLRFHGMEIVGGTGRYAGATGGTVGDKDVPGGSEFVVKIQLR